MIRILWAVFLLSACANAQFQFGVEAGVPLTNTLSATQSQPIALDAYSSQTKLLLIGPTVGLNLPGRLRVELDALYQRINYQHTCSCGLYAINHTEDFSSNTANRWQFPLLLQYRFKIPLLKPFIEGGPSLSLIANGDSKFLEIASNPFVSPPQEYFFSSQTSHLTELQRSLVLGVAVGVGLDFHPAFFHVRPEIRYTHWGASQFSAISQYGPSDTNTGGPTVTVPSLSSPPGATNSTLSSA
jgi:hypothetical protein